MSLQRAAIYARYSSDLQSPTSIEDQIRKCRQYADTHNLTIDDKNVFKDKASSATTIHRDELQNLLRAAKAQRFDVVVIDDSSRLSRDVGDAATILKQLQFYNVRVISVSQGFDSSHEFANLLFTINAVVDSEFVRGMSKKTLRSMTGTVLRGFSPGGSCYGYRRVQMIEGNKIILVKGARGEHVRLEIDEDEAKIVLRIFIMASQGMGLKAIAKQLTAEGIRPPQPRKGRIPSWCSTGIRSMLRNRRYIGEVNYPMTRKVRDPNTGKRITRARPESECVHHEMPELRIIDDQLWQTVQAKLAVHQQPDSIPRRADGTFLGRGGAGRSHLLTGLLKCSECGGDLSILVGAGKNRHAKYGCGNYRNRGVCTNDLREREDAIQERLFAKLQSEVLGPEIVEFAVAEFGKQLQARLANVTAHLDQDRKRADALGRELKNLWATRAQGGDFESLREAIAERDAELKVIRERLTTAGRNSVDADIAEIRAFVTRELSDIKGLLNQDVPTAKAWLSRHVEAITMTPSGTYYTASGNWNLLGRDMRDSGGAGRGT